MIEYLKGTLDELTPALAVVECGGVGYGVNISLNTFSALQGKQQVKLWITEAIREDAYQLWGFSTRQERELFLLLTSVSGIGAAMARMVLSAMTASELCSVISDGNDKMLRQVKGIGPKAAQRIIVTCEIRLLPWASIWIQAEVRLASSLPTTRRCWMRLWLLSPCWASARHLPIRLYSRFSMTNQRLLWNVLSNLP